jgi:hypothetical protein
MTITATLSSVAPVFSGAQYDYERVAFDLYRDIHKGIRAELFDITSTAGRIDPADQLDRIALAGHVASVKELLTLHAEHEDSVIDPVLEAHMPDLADQIERDHVVLEARFGMIDELAAATAEAEAADGRRLGHLLYLELTGFTSAYLAHQLVEEHVVMPALEQAVGVEAVIGLHMQIVGSIAPDVMARSLSFMLPAMNIDDRTELLGGMRMSAPPQAFDAVAGLARSVLAPLDFAGLAARLGLG